MKLNVSFTSTLALVTASLGFQMAAVGQPVYSPVALTQSSYTYRTVVASNSIGYYPGCINAFVGTGISFADNTYYEQGMYAPFPGMAGYNSGVPVHGTVFTNINNANMTFLMPPSYETNDDMIIVNNTGSGYGSITSGTFTFTTPVTATSLAILCTGGNGGCTVVYTVNHMDGSTNGGTLQVPDWFSGNSGYNAWGCNGRMNQAGNFNNFNNGPNNTSVPYLHQFAGAVSSGSPCVSVTFTYLSGGGVDNFFAISAANGSSVYTPVQIASGWNEASLIPAQPFPVTATMDNGTNLNPNIGGLGNTWYEQGYYTLNPSTGLPPSGSTFTSQSQPTHTYQMGNYSTNCAILIDTNHQSANIVPASPANFTGYAFLTCGADIGGGNKMTNLCILEHADGVRETNLFFGYDWFESGVPNAIAYESSGRVSMNNRTINAVGTGFPYMFESYFPLTDTTSPVTNIVVQYKKAPSGNATTYIMAVSATTSLIPPLITEEPTPATQGVFASQPGEPATISVLVSGTAPITNIWLIESNGVYVTLNNGTQPDGTVVSGADTTTLTVSDIPSGGVEFTNYEYEATNGAGGAISSLAAITQNAGSPVGPIIDSQIPAASFSVFTNHADVTAFSVTVDATSSTPLAYQWYSATATATNPIPGATGAAYNNIDTNNITIYCVVTNFAGFATSSPVSVTIINPPAPTAYQSTLMGYGPVSYWPLNETVGSIAFDYVGTNDGAYTGNFTLGAAGVPNTTGFGANNYAAGFDGSTAYVSIPGSGNLNIAGPLTIMQWVQPPSGGDTGFTTSLGHSDQSYRLDVAGGQPHFACPGPDVVDPRTINDGGWHFLVGVYDGTNEYLYVDNILVAQPLVTAGGPFSQDIVTIGAAPDYLGGRNFNGNIAQVAIFSNALSAAQLQAIYYSLDTPPTVSVTPAAPSIYSGQNLTLTANVDVGGSGGVTPASSLQWFVIDNSSVSNIIVGATNSTLTLNNVPVTDSGFTYGVIAANAFGANNASVVLTVQDMAAFLSTDLAPLVAEAFAGAPVTYTIYADGSLPISYQWSINGTNVAGATSSTMTTPIPCGTNLISVSFLNAFSGGTPVVSSTATVIGVSTPPVVTFETNGADWKLNPTGGLLPTLTNGVLELTDGNGGENGSAYYDVAQFAARFNASFVYTAGGNRGADGVAFVIQNSASSSNALGGGGGQLGYTGVSNSLALEIDLYNAVGINAETNGITYASGGPLYGSTGSISVNSGDPIQFNVSWAAGVLDVNMKDLTTLATYSTNYTLGPITPILGGSDLGFVGFSGADGGVSSIQTISNFSFESVIPPVALTVAKVSATSATITWPVANSVDYQLQMATAVNGPWTAGPAPTVVGANNQVTIALPGASTQTFYRLVRLPPCGP